MERQPVLMASDPARARAPHADQFSIWSGGLSAAYASLPALRHRRGAFGTVLIICNAGFSESQSNGNSSSGRKP